MTALDLMRSGEPFAASHLDMPNDLQPRAKRICWQLDQLDPSDTAARMELLSELLGTCPPVVGVNPPFRCDYGFNIHLHGFVLVNYGCSFLDTSPINIGAGTMIAPGVVLACAGHAVHPAQRAEGVLTSAPITIGDNVWIGANVVVCGGVTIGSNSVIGAGSVVTHDVPEGVVAAGSPCRVLHEVRESDRVEVRRLG